MNNPVIVSDGSSIKLDGGNGLEVDEFLVRSFFLMVDPKQAQDTLRVCEGIVQARLLSHPKRARRKDAGKPRPADRTRMLDEPIDLKELGKP